MTNWFLPTLLDDEARQAALQGRELAIPAEGLANISRAQGPDQIAEWLRQLHPEESPEQIAAQAQHFWQLGHELLTEDIAVVRIEKGSAYMMGEISGACRQEERSAGICHVWPVEWICDYASAQSLPQLEAYAAYGVITEILGEHALESLKPHIPALRKSNSVFFRWLSIIILIFELIYFWPRGDN